jgi:hypothetical protein
LSEPTEPIRLSRILWALLGVTPIRLALAAAGLAASILEGDRPRPAVLGFLLGAAGGAFFVLADPRRRWGAARERTVADAPATATVEPWWQSALRATLPSTLGLALLSALALAFSYVLVALLAGIIAGLGLAGLAAAGQVWLEEQRLRGRLLADRHTPGVLFVRR